MKLCGACEGGLPKESFSGTQWKLRKSLRRCNGCVTAGKELVLFTKGCERLADDECPICSRLLPLDCGDSALYICCMKKVCGGCIVTAYNRGLCGSCPFCRASLAGDDGVHLAQIQKRVKVNDPEAIRHLGACYMDGDHGLEKDMSRAVELFERAAELGFKEAHFELATIFNEDIDDSGIAKDMVRAVEHYEIAAKQGHVTARHNLGVNDSNAGNCDLALKHWMISAKLGSAGSLNAIKDLYTKGLASKSDDAGALRGYHDAVTEMSSPERDNVMKTMRDGAKALAKA